MATKIRLRRRTNNALNTNVVLAAGEPYYNTTSKHLYVGNKDNDLVDVETKKHIAQITTLDELNSNNKIAFQIGEDPDNKFEQLVDNVSNATKAEQLVNWKDESTSTMIKFSFGPRNEYGVSSQIGGDISGTIDSAKDLTESIKGKPIESILDLDHCSALRAHAATYTTENNTETIESRLDELYDAVLSIQDGAVEDVGELQATVAGILNGNNAVGNLTNLSLTSEGTTLQLRWGGAYEHSTTTTLTRVWTDLD